MVILQPHSSVGFCMYLPSAPDPSRSCLSWSVILPLLGQKVAAATVGARSSHGGSRKQPLWEQKDTPSSRRVSPRGHASGIQKKAALVWAEGPSPQSSSTVPQGLTTKYRRKDENPAGHRGSSLWRRPSDAKYSEVCSAGRLATSK